MNLGFARACQGTVHERSHQVRVALLKFTFFHSERRHPENGMPIDRNKIFVGEVSHKRLLSKTQNSAIKPPPEFKNRQRSEQILQEANEKISDIIHQIKTLVSPTIHLSSSPTIHLSSNPTTPKENPGTLYLVSLPTLALSSHLLAPAPVSLSILLSKRKRKEKIHTLPLSIAPTGA